MNVKLEIKTVPRQDGFILFNSPIPLALSIAGLFLALFNGRFWIETSAAFWQGAFMDGLFLLALLVLLLFAYTAALLMVPGTRTLIAASVVLFPVGAMAAFCADSFGLVIDREMIRSFFATDRKESLALLTPRLAVYAAGLGVLPLFFVGAVRVAPIGMRRHLLHRLAFCGAGLVVCAALMLAFESRFRSFITEHRQLHHLTVPGAAVQAIAQFAHERLLADQAGLPVETDEGVHRIDRAQAGRPLLVFLVIGETARGRNFQLGGHARATNPELSRLDDLYYFVSVTSCGTTTAVSLPCMFSPAGRARFALPRARQEANVLDTLTQAGLDVEWRANNSGGASVRERVRTIDFTRRKSPGLCGEESCLDQILLEGLPEKVRGLAGDTVVVFHQMGSHGPAYFMRYPPAFEIFRPACRSHELARCTQDEIRNAYDNSIAYTDHLLAAKIALLRQASDRLDSMLVYVSDHGESLGENGIHLHGTPYPVAPREQVNIPFILWMSEGYARRFGIDRPCVRQLQKEPFSHDNLYHTLLGATGTRNRIYERGLDMLASCRKKGE